MMKQYNPQLLPMLELFQNQWGVASFQTQQFLHRHRFRLLLLALLFLLVAQKDFRLELNLDTGFFAATAVFGSAKETDTTENVSTETTTALSLTTAAMNDPKRKEQLKYVRRFAEVAQSEMKKYGIPASITLAQGLLESNAGKSPLALKNNNHFGVKCFSRSCSKGHCCNFSDDHHKDFFRIYKSAWESYRAHSLVLTGERYQHLLNLAPTNYRAWAKGLQKAGYATDSKYAEKLIALVETLELTRLDI